MYAGERCFKWSCAQIKVTLCKQVGVNTESKIELRKMQLSKITSNALAKKPSLFHFSFAICSFSFRNVCKRFRNKKIVSVW